MKIDYHVHSEHSPDGQMSIETIINTAKSRGLDGVAICDHDRVFLDDIPDTDLQVIRGAEFSTEYGHLLGLYLKEDITHTDFKTTVDKIHAQGGIAVLAHPYEHLKYKDKIESIVHLLDGIEVFNSRAERKNKNANAMAKILADKYALKYYAGSDAHLEKEVGLAYMDNDTVIGSQSKPVNTAKSQLVKLKKQNAPITKYLRWFAFYIKCLLEI